MRVGLYDVGGLTPALAAEVAAHAAGGARTAGQWHKFPARIIEVGQDLKTSKSTAYGYLTGIQYLASATTSGTPTLCPFAVRAGCADACLVTAGQANRNSVRFARLRKSLYYRQYPELHRIHLDAEISALARRAARLGLRPAVRLNGTSDVDWTSVAARHPLVQFYDYSKVLTRVRRNVQPNYHLTGSYSAADPKYAHDVLSLARDGYPIAVVFRTAAMVRQAVVHGWRGLHVVSGDVHDLTFLQSRGSVIALKAKGTAPTDRSGFVQDL
jgi:hypothetical protein